MAASLESASTLLQAVRLHYGLTIRQLAGVLGASEAQLWQAGTGRRDLFVAALLRLRPLAEALPPPWGSGPPAAAAEAATPFLALPALPHEPAPTPLRRRLHTCRHLLLALDQKLAPARHRQDQARHMLAVLPALASALPPTDEQAARQLPLLEAQARERLNPAATAALALLLVRQQSLQVEAAQLGAWLENISKST